ncbi:MAG: GNAT family N-acetyltransferase [Caldithrix sp.]|nr:GNAT family N-acetyltransferase [Caldithrix sp.]
MMKNYRIRKGTTEDLEFLQDMLYEAVFWSTDQERIPKEDLFIVPEISKLLKDFFRRSGDYSLIATDEKEIPIGAAWYRFYTNEDHGFGFVDSSTPELGISMVEKYRGKGIGKELMTRLLENAKSRGIKNISLSVDPKNHALHLYEALGFKKVSESGTSWTLLKDLD